MCRGANFAPKLQVGDRVAYMTVKGKYPGDSSPGWCLVAVLRVMERLASHTAAADWYSAKGLDVPSNCIVSRNPPKTFDLTNGKPPNSVKQRIAAEAAPEKAVRLWDAIYRSRITKSPMFVVCEPEFLKLKSPPQLQESDLMDIFGKIPGTQNPPRIQCEQLDRLLKTALSRCSYQETHRGQDQATP
jgi:hypothetical protein